MKLKLLLTTIATSTFALAANEMVINPYVPETIEVARDYSSFVCEKVNNNINAVILKKIHDVQIRINDTQEKIAKNQKNNVTRDNEVNNQSKILNILEKYPNLVRYGQYDLELPIIELVLPLTVNNSTQTLLNNIDECYEANGFTSRILNQELYNSLRVDESNLARIQIFNFEISEIYEMQRHNKPIWMTVLIDKAKKSCKYFIESNTYTNHDLTSLNFELDTFRSELIKLEEEKNNLTLVENKYKMFHNACCSYIHTIKHNTNPSDYEIIEKSSFNLMEAYETVRNLSEATKSFVNNLVSKN